MQITSITKTLFLRDPAVVIILLNDKGQKCSNMRYSTRVESGEGWNRYFLTYARTMICRRKLTFISSSSHLGCEMKLPDCLYTCNSPLAALKCINNFRMAKFLLHFRGRAADIACEGQIWDTCFVKTNNTTIVFDVRWKYSNFTIVQT